METSISALTFGVVHFAGGGSIWRGLLENIWLRCLKKLPVLVRVWEETANPSSNLAAPGPAYALGQQGKKMLPGKSSW